MVKRNKKDKYNKYKILHFDSIDSTNTFVLKNYKNLNNFDAIVSDIQTNGRGRRENKWNSHDSKNIYLTLVIKPDEKINYSVAELSQVVALSVYDATIDYLNNYLRQILNHKKDSKFNNDNNNKEKKLKNIKLDSININKANKIKRVVDSLKIKWPNDILIGDKKLSGILIETVFKNNSFEVIAIGIGFNLNSDQEFLKTINKKATSLFIEIGTYVEKEQFINNLINYIINYYELWKIQGFKHFFDKWVNIIELKDKDIYINLNDENNNKVVLCTVKEILPDFKIKVIKKNTIMSEKVSLKEYIVDLTQVVIR